MNTYDENFIVVSVLPRGSLGIHYKSFIGQAILIVYAVALPPVDRLLVPFL